MSRVAALCLRQLPADIGGQPRNRHKPDAGVRVSLWALDLSS